MKIIGIDYPCIDLGVICDELPEDGGWAPIRQSTLMGGGKIPNALVAAARLGAQTGIAGSVASDSYGIKCREDLEFNGVSTEKLLERPGTTGLCICISDLATGGKRCIESVAQYERMRPSELDEEYFADADMLLLYEMDETAVAAAEITRRHGGLVLVDGDEYDGRTQKSLKLVDVLIMSEYYYRALFGDSGDFETCLESICKAGPSVAIVTLGAEGCAGVAPNGFFRLPAFSGNRIMDTTGAGDVFHGAFGYFYCTGLNAGESARYASAVSYIKCSRPGGRTAVPTRKGVEYFLRTGAILEEDFDERADFYRNAVFQ